MSNPGLFGWIRDGVKHSVLMGVNDAMEVLGHPQEPEALHPAMQSLAHGSLQRMGTSPTEPAAPRSSNESAPARKRLGRSLKDIAPTSKSAAAKPAP